MRDKKLAYKLRIEKALTEVHFVLNDLPEMTDYNIDYIVALKKHLAGAWVCVKLI